MSENRIASKKFDFSSIKGISANQLEQHYKLYDGYVKRVNQIWNILDQTSDFNDPNTTFSDIRSLKLGESYALDGVKLHELYFENLTGLNTIPHGPVLELINRDYGSFERFIKRLKDVALAMRGWAILAIDNTDNKLHIFGLDAHDVGAIWMACPILALDVYEHAYMIDFGIDRKKYIDIFIKNIDWNVVNNRLMGCSSFSVASQKKSLKRSLYDCYPTYYPNYCPFWTLD